MCEALVIPHGFHCIENEPLITDNLPELDEPVLLIALDGRVFKGCLMDFEEPPKPLFWAEELSDSHYSECSGSDRPIAWGRIVPGQYSLLEKLNALLVWQHKANLNPYICSLNHKDRLMKPEYDQDHSVYLICPQCGHKQMDLPLDLICDLYDKFQLSELLSPLYSRDSFFKNLYRITPIDDYDLTLPVMMDGPGVSWSEFVKNLRCLFPAITYGSFQITFGKDKGNVIALISCFRGYWFRFGSTDHERHPLFIANESDIKAFTNRVVSDDEVSESFHMNESGYHLEGWSIPGLIEVVFSAEKSVLVGFDAHYRGTSVQYGIGYVVNTPITHGSMIIVPTWQDAIELVINKFTTMDMAANQLFDFEIKAIN